MNRSEPHAPAPDADAAPAAFRQHLHVGEGEIDLAHLIDLVADARSGAVATFLGTVRSPNHGRRVHAIDYQAYESMARAEAERIATELREAHPLLGLALVHRVGRCLPGEASIAIVACSAHREAAFDACRAALEACKARLPIWKHEEDDGGAHWVEGRTLGDVRL